VQMQGKAGFKHRLAAQSFRFLQLHPQVQHLEVVVVVPHHRLRLGANRRPRQLGAFLAGVHWLSLEELGQQPGRAWPAAWARSSAQPAHAAGAARG
jgi:hypothetical protein